MPTARIRFTPDLVVEALRRYRRQHRGRYVSVAAKLLALAVLIPLGLWSLWERYLLAGVIFTALGVLMFIAHRVDDWLARRSAKKSPFCDDDLTIDLTEDAFHARSPKQDAKLQWSVFTKVVHFRDGFLLFQGPKVFNWIPLSSLSSTAQAAELDTLLRAKIAEHRIIEPRTAP